MIVSLEALRRRAKTLRKSYESGDRYAAQRVHAEVKRPGPMRHADFLHVIAREERFESWPKLKRAAETQGLDRAAKVQRLKLAVTQGQTEMVRHLLWDTPDLAKGDFGLEVALYDLPAVAAVLAADPGAAVRPLGGRRPLHFLCFSTWFRARPDLEPAMLEIAARLRAAGADVNAGLPQDGGGALSPLYGALGQAGNMRLAEWLLANGADPNDGESLYHATELGHSAGVALLLRHGARPEGTNALARALDFNDHETVTLLLAHGADPNEGSDVAGLIAALPQAARRGADAEMIRLLLDHGADPNGQWQGVSAYALARVFGYAASAALLAEAGADTQLSAVEAMLAAAAEGAALGGYVDPALLPAPYRDLLGELARLPGRVPHLRRLVALGLEWDRPGGLGLTPVQVAGWEGLPEGLAYLLSLAPDLSHVNHFGGTLLSTILRGAEAAPDRDARDHLACLRLALEHGVALPARAIEDTGREDIAAFLADWAARYPGQVVAGGVG